MISIKPILMFGVALSMTGCALPPTQSLPSEKPAHAVQIDYSFSLGKYEVTFAEWDACVADGGCTYRPDDMGWGRGDRPVINVSYDDITRQYLVWLNSKFGLIGSKSAFRLPTEAEWEYAARAGTITVWSCGDTTGCLSSVAVYGVTRSETVGSKSANAFGLHDMHGNVWEWVQDCWNDSYSGAPTDGSAWTTGECSKRVVRGGSWLLNPGFLRSAYRGWDDAGLRIGLTGLRLARTLP